jgi:hypothetical protein
MEYQHSSIITKHIDQPNLTHPRNRNTGPKRKAPSYIQPSEKRVLHNVNKLPKELKGLVKEEYLNTKKQNATKRKKNMDKKDNIYVDTQRALARYYYGSSWNFGLAEGDKDFIDFEKAAHFGSQFAGQKTVVSRGVNALQNLTRRRQLAIKVTKSPIRPLGARGRRLPTRRSKSS